ncbi:hypothetical protein [Luteolibacter soli]|uniref:Uncharacterized protein n=1 Tax=Luteolibacter soli TaxID=3135280 RepID=A0ABU9B4G3_9BACT
MKFNHPLLILAATSLPLLAGPVFDVRSSDGKAIKIELLELSGENVTFNTVGEKGGKEHSLALARFDPDSQKKILDEGKDLPPRLPKLDIEVVVSKKKDKDGYYMVNQTVSARVKLKNTNPRIAFPKSTVHLTYFGRSRENAANYKVMGRKTFECELAAGKQTEEAVEGFKTRYDSDNAGDYNLGGYQYDSYLLVITDAAGNVIDSRTSDAGVRALLAKDLSKAAEINKTAVNKILNKDLVELK